jgi:hypothetical protein
MATLKDYKNTLFEMLYYAVKTIFSYLEDFYTNKQLKYKIN